MNQKDWTFLLIVLLVVIVLYFLCRRRVVVDNDNGTETPYKLSDDTDSMTAANMIKYLKTHVEQFMLHLKSIYPNDARVKTMCDRYMQKKTVIEESKEPETYTLNKGEKLVMCLRNYKKNKELHDDINLVMFVCLHEMAHIMSLTNQHTPEFWSNFRFILTEAVKFGIYKAVDYKYDPRWYCAMLVYENPYFDEFTIDKHINQINNILGISVNE